MVILLYKATKKKTQKIKHENKLTYSLVINCLKCPILLHKNHVDPIVAKINRIDCRVILIIADFSKN